MTIDLLERLRDPGTGGACCMAGPPPWPHLPLPGRVRLFAADKPTVANSIRSLTNPYHASWNKGGAAFAASVGPTT